MTCGARVDSATMGAGLAATVDTWRVPSGRAGATDSPSVGKRSEFSTLTRGGRIRSLGHLDGSSAQGVQERHTRFHGIRIHLDKVIPHPSALGRGEHPFPVDYALA